VDAGADGVEIHGANGYLIQKFFAPNANVRTDAYGGSIENRARFAIEVAKAVAEEIGAKRTGIHLSPGGTLGGLEEGFEGPDLCRYLVGKLNKLGLAYVHLMQVRRADERARQVHLLRRRRQRVHRLPDAGREGGGVMQPIKLDRGTKRGDRQEGFVIEILHPIRTGVEPCGLPTRAAP
jgi:2,4-dienoyl-CoA reductase-like NADH-dependent reductase (Old Yellow Enzyme family)